MKRKAILLGVLTLFVAGSASAKIMDTWTRISLQFTNLARARRRTPAIGVTTLTTTAAGAPEHLRSAPVIGTIRHTGRTRTARSRPLAQHDPSGDGPDRVERRHRVRAPDRASARASCPVPQSNLGVLGPISGAIASTHDARRAASAPCPRRAWSASACWFRAARGNLPLDVGATVNGVAVGGGVGGILTIGQLGTIRISILGAPYTVKTDHGLQPHQQRRDPDLHREGLRTRSAVEHVLDGPDLGRAAGRHREPHHDAGRAGEQRHLRSVRPHPRALHSGAGAAAPARLGRRRHGAARPQADPQVEPYGSNARST